MTDNITDYQYVHGRCRPCEKRTGIPTVYAWAPGPARRLKHAHCVRCPDHPRLTQTALALLKTVQVLLEDPIFDTPTGGPA